MNQEIHYRTIKEFLAFINEKTENFVLKGGTALSVCYALDRFSGDIDFNGRERNLFNYVKEYCENKGYDYRIAKDTELVQRGFIYYLDKSTPLKIEASYRSKNIASDEVTKVKGINVYTLDALCTMKCNAYLQRDRIRDLYDLSFIILEHYDELSKKTILQVVDALSYKGLEQFDYLINTQTDRYIDNEVLETKILQVFDKLGILDNREFEAFDNKKA